MYIYNIFFIYENFNAKAGKRVGEIAHWLVKVIFPETKRISKITANKSKVTEVRLQGKRVSVHIVLENRFKTNVSVCESDTTKFSCITSVLRHGRTLTRFSIKLSQTREQHTEEIWNDKPYK